MTPDSVMAIGHQAIQITVMIVALLLVPALIIGILVSVFQAATQINEQTLSFIPKLLTTFIVLMIGGPWILATLVGYLRRMLEDIPMLIG